MGREWGRQCTQEASQQDREADHTEAVALKAGCTGGAGLEVGPCLRAGTREQEGPAPQGQMAWEEDPLEGLRQQRERGLAPQGQHSGRDQAHQEGGGQGQAQRGGRRGQSPGDQAEGRQAGAGGAGLHARAHTIRTGSEAIREQTKPPAKALQEKET